jgi:hypothetical protein
MRSEEHDQTPFVRIVETFRPDDRPAVLWMTGGEPLLRPHLVGLLAEAARRAGTTTALLTGMWFGDRPPPLVQTAMRSVDHLSVSIDRFHEQEVPRASTLAVIGQLVEEGRDVSVHLVGEGPDDPYLHAAIGEIRTTLTDRCPIHVSFLQRYGRAERLLPARARAGTGADASPCQLVSWPVVGYDGTVLACCSQLAVDGPVPDHLRLGHAAIDDWPVIRARAEARTMLRALRTFGPGWIAENDGAGTCGGYCETCLSLSDDPDVEQRVAMRMNRPGAALLQERAEEVRRRSSTWVDPRFAHLLELGHPTAA